MKSVMVSFLAGLVFTAPVLAETWTTYDYNSGNSMTHTRDSMGTYTQGFNTNTGATWNIQQNTDGTYNGVDADGNYFYGDNNSGYYSNTGTGETCIGTGYARTCY